MRFSFSVKHSAYLLSALLLLACQPPVASEGQPDNIDNSTGKTPITINDDSVMMTPDHILNIKSSRYQPSLGLQGKIEPIKQTKFLAASDIIVEQVLVAEGEWVDAGTPLLVVRRQMNKKGENADLQDIPTSETSSVKNTATVDKSTDNTTKSNITSTQYSVSQKPATQSSGELSESANLSKSKTLAKTDINDPVAVGKGPSIASTGRENAQNAAEDEISPYELFTVNASFSGRVENLYIVAKQQVKVRQPLLQFSDKSDLHFIATLPIQAKPQLSVGQTVNFVTEGLNDKFTGQVSDLQVSTAPQKLLVYVSVIDAETSRHKLQPDMTVTGRVDYGQIEVGTIVPEHALHDVDLAPLKRPPYQPLFSLKANVWIIKQDQHLTRQPVEVIKYDPSSGQYLIAGINNDSLIFLANLPIDAIGKKAVVS